MNDYKAHPIAEAFPLIEGVAFDDLVADIKANGLLEPITLYDSLILDGRNRYRACIEAGERPRFVELSPDDDPIAFVVSRNIHRRHLTDSQRAYAAATLANLQHGQKIADVPIGITQPKAADALNVSTRSVARAAKVRKQAIPEIQEAVRDGP